MLAELLHWSGYQVLEAEDGQHGLELALAHAGDIDLLLTDVLMPRMQGDKLGAHFKRIRRQVATVYMSGYYDGVPLDPAATFLRKPFSNQTLVAKVNEVLAVRAAAS